MGCDEGVEIVGVKGRGIEPEPWKQRTEDAVGAGWVRDVVPMAEHEPVDMVGLKLDDHVLGHAGLAVVLDQLGEAGELAVLIDPAQAAQGFGNVEDAIGLRLAEFSQDGRRIVLCCGSRE